MHVLVHAPNNQDDQEFIRSYESNTKAFRKYNVKQGLQFRPIPPGTGGTYRSARLLVRGPPATGRFRQKSTVGNQLREKSTVGGRLRKKKGRRRGKGKKKRREERIPRPRAILACRRRRPQVACAPSPPAHRRRLRAVAARGRGCFFSRTRRRSVSPRGETD
ncbi:hypothetical protein BHE74_00046486 [Ensete ventricosum]|nr:hypothetical protein BHE74_00046486 [Ensete ventricosum]RZS26552.1 hypothetical protein BHM03_00059899 [Ensete ventricosum]